MRTPKYTTIETFIHAILYRKIAINIFRSQSSSTTQAHAEHIKSILCKTTERNHHEQSMSTIQHTYSSLTVLTEIRFKKYFRKVKPHTKPLIFQKKMKNFTALGTVWGPQFPGSKNVHQYPCPRSHGSRAPFAHTRVLECYSLLVAVRSSEWTQQVSGRGQSPGCGGKRTLWGSRRLLHSTRGPISACAPACWLTLNRIS